MVNLIAISLKIDAKIIDQVLAKVRSEFVASKMRQSHVSAIASRVSTPLMNVESILNNSAPMCLIGSIKTTL